jgi:chromosome segregation ATPase
VSSALSSAFVGIASFLVAALSFIYASRAQRSTRQAEAAQAQAAIVAVDAAAYARAKELYESGVETVNKLNALLKGEVSRLNDEKVELLRRMGDLEVRVRELETQLHGGPPRGMPIKPPGPSA